MALPFPIDPSLPSNPSPLFSDVTAARGDHLRANNAEIWANFVYIVNTILGGAVLSVDGTMAANSDLKFASEKALVTYVAAMFNSMLPIGFEAYWPGITPPPNWIARDGSNLLRASYPALFSALAGKTATCTLSLASPCVITLTDHGLQTRQCVSFETTGALPSAITAGSSYYVTVINSSTFYISDTMAHCIAGQYINTNGESQSGTHTLRYSSWGTSDLTHFFAPDDRGIHVVGSGIQGTATGWAGSLSNHVGIPGYYNEDGFQAFQSGLVRSGTTRYGFSSTLSDNYRTASGSNIAGHATPEYFSGSQGDATKITAVNDGTHGTPRGGGHLNAGYITSPARVGHLAIIKYQ